jgi:prenyltransferase beta subunit
MRRDADFFGEVELDLLYMARRLREALQLEKLLTEAGINYMVETGTYTGGFLLKRELAGAFFYVAPADISSAREILIKNRYKPYEPE